MLNDGKRLAVFIDHFSMFLGVLSIQVHHFFMAVLGLQLWPVGAAL